jgi:hypothetical protein
LLGFSFLAFLTLKFDAPYIRVEGLVRSMKSPWLVQQPYTIPLTAWLVQQPYTIPLTAWLVQQPYTIPLTASRNSYHYLLILLHISTLSSKSFITSSFS